MLARQMGQDDGRQGGPRNTPRGSALIRSEKYSHEDASGDEERRDDRVDEQIDLADRNPEHRGENQRDHPRDSVVRAPQARSDQHPQRGEKRKLERELDEAGGPATPHASATMGVSSTGASQSAATMRQTLSSTGVKAGITKRP